MMITGDSLRRARESRGMRRQEFADALDISLRTVGNWERLSRIPKKYWPAIQALLPEAVVLLDGEGEHPPSLYATGQPLGGPWQNAEALQAVVEAWEAGSIRLNLQLGNGLSEREVLERMVQLAWGVDRSVDFALMGYELGVRPRLLVEYVQSATSVLLGSGAGAVVTNDPELDPVRSAIERSVRFVAMVEGEEGVALTAAGEAIQAGAPLA